MLDTKPSFEQTQEFLAGCDDIILRYLELQLGFARDIRNYQLEYNVSDKEFAVEFGCDISKVPLLRRGATEISLRDMANLQSLYAFRISSEKAMIKVNPNG